MLWIKDNKSCKFSVLASGRGDASGLCQENIVSDIKNALNLLKGFNAFSRMIEAKAEGLIFCACGARRIFVIAGITFKATCTGGCADAGTIGWERINGFICTIYTG